MCEHMKKSWWKIPVYCIVAGWICFHAMVRFGSRFAIVTLPDGTVTADNSRWLIMSGVAFFVTLAVGGLAFFRKMTRKELLCSASVMFVFNLVCGLASYFSQVASIGLFFSKISEWSGFLDQLLYEIGLNPWFGAVIAWAAPYLFVLFGKASDASSGGNS